MKYYIIAGEASGDLHGSNLIRELRQRDHEAAIRCWGGDKMQEAGATLVKHYRDLAFMGFVEVIRNLRTIFKNLAWCKTDIQQYQPDVLVLVDYPGFNLRIAKWAHAMGYKVIYYISPQVWAWKENRVKMMKQCIDLMLVILPFEKAFYEQKWQWPVHYVGHPLVDVIRRYKSTADAAEKLSLPKGTEATPIIALLPGSRQQEILKKLPVMLEVAQRFPQYHFVVAKAPGLASAFYDSLLASYPNVSYVNNQTYPLLLQSKAALVTSGTATLETALFGVPEVICYKGNSISYQIAKRLISIRFIGLVNLIMDKEVVKELIQDEMNANNLSRELDLLLHNPAKKAQIADDYAALQRLLGKEGNASAVAAQHILHFLHPQKYAIGESVSP
jgi:lipid-A-disaccharide synthase